ncbi:MAG: 3-phosphoshikimate 1-carboxyvinyltransferase, partial [Candidatus Geothermarchaeales archaeon]
GGSVTAPPSKSYTHRAILISLMAEGRSRISNPLYSGDTWASIYACRALGGEVDVEKRRLTVEGSFPLRSPETVIDVENSGTTMRLVTALSAHVEEGYTVLTGDESIRRRPMQPLIEALNQLGANCWSTRLNGLPPIVVRGGGLRGGEVEIRGDVSSQFISALLVASPPSKRQTTIKVSGDLVSKPYVEMTLETLREASVRVEGEHHQKFVVPAPQRVEPLDFKVPGDLGLSAFMFALAAVTGSTVEVHGFDFSRAQSDVEVLALLREMGCEVEVDEVGGSVKIKGDRLRGSEFNLVDSPDLLPVAAVLGAKAEGRTIIRGVRHARFKESDRISRLASELPKLGVKASELEDGIVVEGGEKMRGCKLQSYGDHRLFMAFCVAAAGASEPCEVEGVESAFISYPDFVKDVEKLGIKVEEVKD